MEKVNQNEITETKKDWLETDIWVAMIFGALTPIVVIIMQILLESRDIVSFNVLVPVGMGFAFITRSDYHTRSRHFLFAVSMLAFFIFGFMISCQIWAVAIVASVLISSALWFSRFFVPLEDGKWHLNRLLVRALGYSVAFAVTSFALIAIVSFGELVAHKVIMSIFYMTAVNFFLMVLVGTSVRGIHRILFRFKLT